MESSEAKLLLRGFKFTCWTCSFRHVPLDIAHLVRSPEIANQTERELRIIKARQALWNDTVDSIQCNKVIDNYANVSEAEVDDSHTASRSS